MFMHLLIYTASIKCSVVLSLFTMADNSDPYLKYAQLIILLAIGLFIAILGIQYFKTSLFLLITLSMGVFFNDIYLHIQSAAENDTTFLFLSADHWEWLLEAIDENPKLIGFGMLVLAAILSYLFVVMVNMLSLIGFAIVCIYLYREGFHEKALLRFGIDNDIVKYVLCILFIIALYFAFVKVPKIVFACFFALIGSLMSVMAIEMLIGTDWGFYAAFTELKEKQKVNTQPAHLLAFVMLSGCFVAYQCYVVINGKC